VLDATPSGAHHQRMTVSPLPQRGGIQRDLRDAERVLRVSAHPDSGVVTVSMWRGDDCVATHRMAPADVPALIGLLADALAACADPHPARADAG